MSSYFASLKANVQAVCLVSGFFLISSSAFHVQEGWTTNSGGKDAVTNNPPVKPVKETSGSSTNRSAIIEPPIKTTDLQLMNLKGKVESISVNYCTTKMVAGKPEKDSSLRQETFVFNEKGFITAKYDYGSYADLVAIVQHTYNAQNNLVQQDFFDGASVYKGSIISTYDARGNQVTETDNRLYSYNKNLYGYDEHGNKTYEKNMTRIDTSEFHFTYNSQNQLIGKTDFFLTKGGKYSTATYKYDPNGKLIEVLEERHRSGEKVKVLYTYDSKGRRNGSASYSDKGNFLSRNTQSYDQYDNLLEYYYYLGSYDSVWNKKLQKYTYDSQGNWITQFSESDKKTNFLERLVKYF